MSRTHLMVHSDRTPHAAIRRASRLVSVVATLALMAFGFAGTAAAQPQDDLECYELRVTRGQWTADLGNASQPLVLTPFAPPFTVETGCRLVPSRNPRPRQVCVPSSVSPSQAPAGQALSNLYACYKMRCPREADLDLAFTTQFGAGTRSVHRSTGYRRVCVPASIGPVTPTATPTSGPTPTPTAAITPTPDEPTPTPTDEPTPTQTAEPTPTPTADPTPTPTVVPTPTPTTITTTTTTSTTSTVTTISGSTTTGGGGGCTLQCQNGGTLDPDLCVCSCYPNLSGAQCEIYGCDQGHIDPAFCASVTAEQCAEPSVRGACPQKCLC